MVFEDIKILDFSWAAVGPLTIKYLADHGATVVRIESASKPDPLRTTAPFKDMTPGINRSQIAANYNTSKYSLGLNLRMKESQDLVRKIIKTWQPDIVIESFTPRVMKSLGLGYDDINALRPDVIYMSTCQQGQNGPHAHFRGYGNLAAGLAGFYSVTGWPDGNPSAPNGAYSDFINPRFHVPLLIAALDYRRRTGKGQYIDMSQFEVSLQFEMPAILDYMVNGRVLGRRGNRDDMACPHGAYPCQGDDRWCVIAVSTDEQWEALCQVMGNPDWKTSFDTFSARKANEDELDRLIGEWAKDYTAEQVMEMLQENAVPAGVVQSGFDLWEDPQIQHRGFFQWLDHKECGLMPYEGIPFTLSKTPGKLRWPQACLGEHNAYILKEFIGMSDDEIADLVVPGVLEVT